MKKQLLICLLTCYSFSTIAQDKAMLTKEETVNYLDKKMKDIITFKSRFDIGSFTDASVISTNSKIQVLFSSNYADGYRTETTITLDPSKIISIEEGTTSSDIDLLIINVTPNTCKYVKFVTQSDPQPNNYNYWSKNTTTLQPSKIEIPYLKYDGTNFNKFKKALEHLRDLCKAEEDPFGE